MSLEAAILGFLSERPRSGYDLKTRCFDVMARAVWTADQAQVYRTLERLQDARLVSSTRKRQSGKPDRRVYDITPAGRASLSSWLAATQPLPAPRDAFLLQLFFSADLDDAALVRLLEGRRDRHQVRLEDLRAQLREFATADSADRQKALRQAALDGAIAAERSSIDWLDDVLDGIAHGGLPARVADPTDPSVQLGTSTA